MARAGILYSHVAKAAAQLTAAGKNATVDTVREALGGTGSKSTIAPMLKQWKAQHEGEVAAAQRGEDRHRRVEVDAGRKGKPERSTQRRQEFHFDDA